MKHIIITLILITILIAGCNTPQRINITISTLSKTEEQINFNDFIFKTKDNKEIDFNNLSEPVKLKLKWYMENSIKDFSCYEEKIDNCITVINSIIPKEYKIDCIPYEEFPGTSSVFVHDIPILTLICYLGRSAPRDVWIDKDGIICFLVYNSEYLYVIPENIQDGLFIRLKDKSTLNHTDSPNGLQP